MYAFQGNTALHYAMTYKNLDVASILLDSGECCVDLVNQVCIELLTDICVNMHAKVI